MSRRVLVVGLSGKFCAGKSTVGDWLQRGGALNIEADRLGHQAIERERERIAARFGPGVLRGGSVDRKALGALVFGRPAELADLEAIVHPAVIAIIEGMIADRKAELAGRGPAGPAAAVGGEFAHVILVNAALLFKSGLDRICDLVVWAAAPWPLRLWRGLRRDGRGLAATLALMRSQSELGPQYRAGAADIVRVCTVWRRHSRRRVRQILERYDG